MGNPKRIAIRCDGVTTSIPHSDLTILQGQLKTLSEEDIAKIKARIVKVGFKYPLFVWRKGKKLYILDGTERLLAVRSLESDGWAIPDLPVVFVEAGSMKEAKEEVLHLSSSYGKISKKGAAEFVGGADLDFSTVSIQGLDMNTDMALLLNRGYGEEKERTEVLNPYEWMRVLVSFPPALYRKVKAAIAEIEKVEGAEVDKSWS